MNKEFYELYSDPPIMNEIKSGRLRWAGHVERSMEQSKNNAYRVLVGKPDGKRPLGKSRLRWKDNIKMDFREVSFDLGEWIALAEIDVQPASRRPTIRPLSND